MSLNASDLTAGANQVSFQNTKIVVNADGTITITINDAQDFEILANVLRALSGSSIQTDTIDEATSGAGVTVDGVLLKDGGVVPSGFTAQPVPVIPVVVLR